MFLITKYSSINCGQSKQYPCIPYQYLMKIKLYYCHVDFTAPMRELKLFLIPSCVGAWGSVVVMALRYKSEGPGIDFRCRRGFFRGI